RPHYLGSIDACQPVVGAVAVVGGIMLGEHAGPSHAAGALAVAVLGLVAALLVYRWPRVVLVALALAFLGCASMQRALDGREHSPLVAMRDGHASVVVRGTIADDPAGPRFSTKVLVRAATIAPAADPRQRIPLHRIVLVRATGRQADEMRVVAMGDHVELSGRLEALDGFDARLRWRHVTARLVDARLEAFHGPTAPLLRAAELVRSTTLRGTTALAAEDRALFVGFTFGDTRDIAGDVVNAYRDAGLSHLLAVSGANVAFVLALVRPVLQRCSLPSRAALGASIVIVFAAATRFEPSVLRASVMAVVAMAAMLVGRPVSSTRLLSLAVIALLLADPFLVHSVGFALSVGASAGIAWFSRPLAARLPGPRWLREPFAVTVAAQIGVAPVMFAVFGGLPAIAPVANLLAVPVAEPLSVYGLVTSLAVSLVAPVRPLAALLHAPTTVMLRWVTLVARTCARVPLVVDARGALGLLALGCGAAAAWRAGATLRGVGRNGTEPRTAQWSDQ
ncbi:MAG: competence protein ComEC, partial [Actinomycetota bacterium]|nr:competence protein ComEC [Actinomycetota bacterium]